RKVRIRCKRCGADIIVDGTGRAPAARPPASLPPVSGTPRGPKHTMIGVPAPAQPPAGAPEGFGMPSAHAPPAASNARASSSRRKATMVGVAPPAAFSAPEPEPAAQPASQPLPRFDAPSPQVGGGSSFRDRLKARVESGPVIARPPASAPEQPAPMPSAPPPALDARRAPEARVSHPPPPDDVEWLVAITEENQRELTTQQIVSLYLAGTIDPETFIWKDGMDDWATP